MTRFPLVKTLFIAAGLALGSTAAMLAFTTTAPTRAMADIPPPAISGGLPSLAPMLKDVLPAVVNISVVSKVEIQNPLLNDPFFRRFFDMPDEPQQQEAQAIGSGVIVDAQKGYVLTNNHVVEQADEIKVRLSDDRTLDAKLVGRDAGTDIAVLQIKGGNLKALSIGDSDKLQVGDFVVAIGSPFGLRQTVTSGIVSALGRQTGIIEGGYEDFIQTDASINPGNSGGALVNLRGELIGIPSNILSRSGGNIGLGFAIPTSVAKTVMTQLIESGSVQRGRIGIGGQDITPELAKAFNLDGTHGAVVTQVVPGSPAAKAGIKSEDVITEVNGKELRDFAQLRNVVGLMRVGEKVDLKVLREGKPRNITVTIGKDNEQVAEGSELHPKLAGASFGPVDESNSRDPELRGVVVQKIDPRSPAARSGLRPGDVITAVNRKPVTGMADFQKLAGKKEGELLLHIRRGSGALFLLLQ
jgi:serine protease Do/serine protease DegQ